MRAHRLYSPVELRIGAEVDLDANASRHALQALRLRVDDFLILFDGSGDDYSAQLISAEKNTARVRIDDLLRSEPVCKLPLHLAIGVSRGERMDFSIQKAVELGVTEITPLFTERTMVQLKGERLHSRHRHWLGVIRHACEQSGRSRLPLLNQAQRLSDWTNAFHGFGLMLDHRAKQTLPTIEPPQGETVSLLVGPEGGLSQNERTSASQHGFTGIRMGPRVLRTETAPLAALAAMQALWGDFQD